MRQEGVGGKINIYKKVPGVHARKHTEGKKCYEHKLGGGGERKSLLKAKCKAGRHGLKEGKV